MLAGCPNSLMLHSTRSTTSPVSSSPAAARRYFAFFAQLLDALVESSLVAVEFETRNTFK